MGKIGKKMLSAFYVIAVFLGTYGVSYLVTWMGMDKSMFSVLGVVVFTILCILWKWLINDWEQITETKDRKRRIFFVAMISFLFALSMIMGYQLQVNGLTECGVRGKGAICIRSVCLALACFPVANLFLYGVERIKPMVPPGTKLWNPKMVFLVCAIIIFACLIPVWLAFYPIIMSYDFHRQINEAANGFAYFWPYQPIAHTWIIWVFLQLGVAVDSLETGFACMALFQMVLYALVTGYACSTLYRLLSKKWIVVLAVLFFGVFPINTVLVICTTKDIIFSVLFLLFMLLLVEDRFFCKEECIEQKKKLFCKKNVINVIWVLEGCLMIQFRNNAFYAVAVFMVLYVLLAAKKEKLRIFILCILLIVGSKATGVAIKSLIGTEMEGAKVEMFSVPIQQFARVGYYHYDLLDEDTIEEISYYLGEGNWERYYPPLSDSVKIHCNVNAFSEDYGRLLSLWFKLFAQYPNEFLDAFLELTRGYWFLDDLSAVENLGVGVETRMGTIFTYNSSYIDKMGTDIVHESKFPWLEEQLLKVVCGNEYYNWPVLSLIFRNAFYPWCMFLITMAYLYKKQSKNLKLVLLPWLYFGTMLLGPVVQIRYIFPIILITPIMVTMLFTAKKSSEK